jgi:hypothetical protein
MGLVKDKDTNKKIKELRLESQKAEGVVKPTPSIKFSKQEIEFLLYLIQESQIPGKRLIEAIQIVEKLQKSYKEQK